MAPQKQDDDLMTDKVEVETSTPILAAAKHLLQPNGSILGAQVAPVIEPLFPTLASAIPTSNLTSIALASIDGRRPLSHAKIAYFTTDSVAVRIA